MTTQLLHSSNGDGPAEPQIYTYRPRQRRAAVRPRRLLFPVLLLLGVVAALRYFEQSTSG